MDRTRLTGWHVLKSGSSSNNGTKAGVTYLNANNGSANAHSAVSVQLSKYVKNYIFSSVHTTALAENTSSMKVLVTQVNAPWVA